MRTRPTIVGALIIAAVLLPGGAAFADETHTHTQNGPSVTNGPVLSLHTGQIDDPLEDVLEHATVVGRTDVQD
ncbi:hypothetical protein J7E93_20115 [Streptomyces sp. ISL-36]|uniref:hypothetical protein n=1 Tax=Streptomyces sp. ISL-36 TaxID=2819182 RepID=UPI001BEB3854|nr:hypothetical protein [Streptomyces sp. ISL-36]MBT2442372.1 hypothetical protein [Streptomyces sp. ISL-36]